jgi:hypothetical protein
MSDATEYAKFIEPGRSYYYVIRACDEVPNCGAYSVVAVLTLPDTMPPRRIVDLRARREN